MTKNEIYREAITKFGWQSQVNMLVEEIGELLSALNKYERGRVELSDVTTEVADVRIMIEQLEVVLDIHDDVECEIKRKIERLKYRLDKKGGEK